MKQLLCLFAILLALPGEASEGGRAGNGFAIHCGADEEFKIHEGYYSLDYLVTLGLGVQAEVSSWEGSATRIRQILNGVLNPQQMELFDDFVDNVRNTKDYSKKRIWEASPFGVLNLKNETSPDSPLIGPLHKEQIKSNLKSLVSKVPTSCLNSKGEVELIPTVVFQDHYFTGRPEGYLVYKFVPQILDELETTDPLQLSYLYIHEWLWDISNNEDRNRRINHLLHSIRVESMTKAEIRSQLRGMGLSISHVPQKNSPLLKSENLREAYHKTDMPTRRLAYEDIPSVLLKGGNLSAHMEFQAYALKRRCVAPNNCTPWEEAVPKFGTPLEQTHNLPMKGELTFAKKENYLVLLKTLPIDIPTGKNQKIATECKLDAKDNQVSNGSCRKMWGPETSFDPLGYLYVGRISLELSVYFTQNEVWVGTHERNGEDEIRMAFVARYPEEGRRVEPLRISRPSRNVGSEPSKVLPADGDYQLVDGTIRRVITIPGFSLPHSGILTRDTDFVWSHHLELPGDLRGLRAYAIYEPKMDNINVSILAPGSGKYGYGSDASPRVADYCYTHAATSEQRCVLKLQPGFAVDRAAGDWKFTFNFQPLTTPVKVESLKVIFEVRNDN